MAFLAYRFCRNEFNVAKMVVTMMIVSVTGYNYDEDHNDDVVNGGEHDDDYDGDHGGSGDDSYDDDGGDKTLMEL